MVRSPTISIFLLALSINIGSVYSRGLAQESSESNSTKSTPPGSNSTSDTGSVELELEKLKRIVAELSETVNEQQKMITVTWSIVIKIAIVYFVLGIFHWLFYKKFMLISLDAQTAANRGVSVRFWDFLFYVSFGIVVTNSVRIAGVLLVFSYLIVPAVCAILFTEKVGKAMGFAVLIGILASVLGLYFSFSLDLPTGAAIVCTFGMLLIASGIIKAFQKEKPVGRQV